MSEIHSILKDSACTLAQKVKQGAVSSLEVVQACLDRIESINPQVNAVVELFADSALEAAEKADQRLRSGKTVGPFHGVPFTVKVNIDQKGRSTNWGVKALDNAIAPKDAPVVERMKRAGGIVIGRTNCPNFGLRQHTESELYGLTKNPWDEKRTCGGSSGGEAVAIATGMSPLGLGNDIGGSLRNPAHCCGITSIKPTQYRVPRHSMIPNENVPISFQLMAVEGVIAKRVEDLKLGLSIIEGYSPYDPLSLQLDPYSPSTRSKGKRMYIMSEPEGSETEQAIVDAVKRAGTILENNGYERVHKEPPSLLEVYDNWLNFISFDIKMLYSEMRALCPQKELKYLNHIVAQVKERPIVGHNALLQERLRLMRAYALWFEEVDILLSPTWTQNAFKVGKDIASIEETFETVEQSRCVTLANLLGLPSVVAPCGIAHNSLPVGVLLTGNKLSDYELLEAAKIIEAHTEALCPINPKFS